MRKSRAREPWAQKSSRLILGTGLNKSGLEKLLKNLVRDELPPCGEASVDAVKDEKPIFDKAIYCFERGCDHGAAEIALQGGEVDSGVEPQAEEPCFFMLPLR